jgi:predicted transcriptional regulator
MKTITINVSEPVYRDFQEHARRLDRTAAELIREAMEVYCKQYIRTGQSLRTLRPLDLGAVIKPLTAHDDLLEEMIDD